MLDKSPDKNHLVEQPDQSLSSNFVQFTENFSGTFHFYSIWKMSRPKKIPKNFISAQNFLEDPKNTKIRILYPKKYNKHTYHFTIKWKCPPPRRQRSRDRVTVQTTHFYLNFPVMVIFLQSL